MKIIEKIHSYATSLGFQLFGATDTRVDDTEVRFFYDWLADGKAGDMSGWLGRSADKRSDPALILPGARSLIMVGRNYYPGDHVMQTGRVARYAWYDDYHSAMGADLQKLADYIAVLGDSDARWYVDTGPIFERYFAAKAGLGFIGKNTCLITKDFGSWVLIGSILTKLEFDNYDAGNQLDFGRCGECRKCIDACPTGALSGQCLDARKCVSYLTIEKRGEFSPEEKEMLGSQDFCFGCDICQEVCPHNIRARNIDSAETPLSNLASVEIPSNETDFNKQFRTSPVKRAQWAGILRNLKVTSPR